MRLEEIERKLKVIHDRRLITPIGLDSHGLTYASIRQILSGENYKVENLIEYVCSLGLLLSCNGYLVLSLEGLGKVFTILRKDLQIKQKDLLAAIKEDYPSFTPTRICTVEFGRGYERKTLQAYLSGHEKLTGHHLEWDLHIGVVGMTEEQLKAL